MRISIVTPTLESARTLRQTIESVLAQGYPDVEHIVMDGGSTDATPAIAAEYPHLVWRSERDGGHYHAMQKGAELATGDVLAILNSDDYYADGTLARVADAFARHPEWDALFGDVRFVDDEGNEIYRREEAKYDYRILLYGVGSLVIDQTLFYRRRVFQELGGFRWREFRNCCDYELILRLGREGYTVGHVDAIFTNYRYHDFGQSADLRIRRNMETEARRIRDQHGAPRGVRFAVLAGWHKARRQTQKLRYRRKLDLVPGWWRVRGHLRQRTVFSSNSGLDRLSE